VRQGRGTQGDPSLCEKARKGEFLLKVWPETGNREEEHFSPFWEEEKEGFLLSFFGSGFWDDLSSKVGFHFTKEKRRKKGFR